jgi:ATP phosphoribosyltransferase regulatory subunit
MARDRWLLPEGVEEILPPDSWRLEEMRRRLLDLYRSWGYELVIPPLIEYLDSLLTGAGHDLDLQTFKLTDQLSGRLMGVRADMTPQAARIDARGLKHDGANRLCYIGSVLRTRPDGLGGSRCPLQVGVELFGDARVEADVEILSLMLETLSASGIRDISVDVGNVGVYRALAAQSGISGEGEEELFEILQRKSRPDLDAFLKSQKTGRATSEMFSALINLNGDIGVLKVARSALAKAGEPVRSAIDTIEAVAQRITRAYPKTAVHVDLAELRGYRYQTGVVFAAFVPGQGREVARGGRYDATGEVFGRARPATGFSADLTMLARLGGAEEAPRSRGSKPKAKGKKK